MNPFGGRRWTALLMLMALATAVFPISSALADEDPAMPAEEGSLEDSALLYEAAESDTSSNAEEEEAPFSFFASPTIRNAYLLLKLKQYLGRAEQNYNSLEERMEDARAEIDENRYTLDELEDQVAHLETLIEQTEAKIHNVELQKAEKEQDIQKSLEGMELTQIEVDAQKRALEGYLQLLYFEQQLSRDSSQGLNGLKILLQDGSVSEVLQRSTYLTFLQAQALATMEELDDLQRTLKRQNYELTVKRYQLETLSEQLKGESRNLTAQWEGKENLRTEVQQSDEIYRELFASYKLAQEAILQEINLFQTNIETLEERVSLATLTLSPEELAMVQQIQNDAGMAYTMAEAADFLDLDWPVAPALGLSAFFDDESYAQTFGVPHNAVDIPVAHGSIIYAPADGVVYKVYDAAASSDPQTRLGYGYMILAHGKGVMTLYGHISSALVREGDFIRRGQIIGLTGATPGTPGAGARTTGAHLHFEVFQNGIRVDPLEYLPLSEVPLDSLPEEYLKILEAQLEASLEEQHVNVEALEETDLETLEAAVEATLQESFFDEEFDDEEALEFWTQGER